MSIRLALWLAGMACGAALLAVRGLLGAVVADGIFRDGLALAICAPIVWLLAWLAYAPVRDVTQNLRSITMTGELDRRSFYAGPRDDVGDLVVAVNDLLVRHDAAVGRLKRQQSAKPPCACPRPHPSPDAADLVLDLGAPREVSQPGSSA